MRRIFGATGGPCAKVAEVLGLSERPADVCSLRRVTLSERFQSVVLAPVTANRGIPVGFSLAMRPEFVVVVVAVVAAAASPVRTH